MSVPSTTSYYPFDSDAPSVFRQTRKNNYWIIAFLGLLLYDHIITLDKEVEWIWTLKWRLPKIIFMFNRYVITSLFMLNCIPDIIFPLPLALYVIYHDTLSSGKSNTPYLLIAYPSCKFHFSLSLFLSLLNFGTAELLIIIRVCSLYGHRKSIVWALGVFYVLAFAGTTVTQTLYDRRWEEILYYKYLPGCWAWDPTTSGVKFEWPVWAIFLMVEGVLMLLAAYKLLSYRNQSNPTITLLARDSLVYFVVIFASVASILATDIEQRLEVSMIKDPTQIMTAIAVGRMMMNLRGLILDDPEHTTHLQTLQFALHTNSGISEAD